MNKSIGNRIVTIARWTARILSVVLIVVIAVAICAVRPAHMAIGEIRVDRLRDMELGSALVTTLAGLAIACRWEGLGSLLIFGGISAFAAVNGIGRTFALNSPFYAFLITGALFSFCWWSKRRQNG